MKNNVVTIGIDVSKQWLDIALPDGDIIRIANQDEALEQALPRLTPEGQMPGYIVFPIFNYIKLKTR